MYCIYRTTNKLTKETYIGQHKYTDLSHDSYIGSGRLLWEAINQYGIENFERTIIISNIKTREEINKLEIYYIKLERESGHSEYNVSDGGDGGFIYKGYNISCGKRWVHDLNGKDKRIPKDSPLPEGFIEGRNEEHCKRMSNSLKGKPKSEEAKKNMRKPKINYCKHKSEEHRINISKANKGKNKSKEHCMNISKSRVNKKYYNNGIECHMYIPGTEPEGYVSGRLHKS